MNAYSQRGSAIIMLFVAVALFGLLGYAFLQGSRNNVGMLTDEASKAASSRAQDCSNAVSIATKRLEARGCRGMISMEPDGSNTVAGAPTDGSCSIYHPNGGGARYCGVIAAPGPSCGATPAIGQTCGDGTIHAGTAPDGNPLFTTPSDAVAMPWNDGNTEYFWTNVSSTTDGRTNTATLVGLDANPVAPGFQNFMAATYCHTLSANGHDDWYLPARSEMHVILANQNTGGLAGTVNGSYYWSSTEDFISAGYYWDVDGNGGGSGMKHFNNMVRCVRQD